MVVTVFSALTLSTDLLLFFHGTCHFSLSLYFFMCVPIFRATGTELPLLGVILMWLLWDGYALVNKMMVKKQEGLEGENAVKWAGSWISCSGGEVVSLDCRPWIRCCRLGDRVRKLHPHAVCSHCMRLPIGYQYLHLFAASARIILDRCFLI